MGETVMPKGIHLTLQNTLFSVFSKKDKPPTFTLYSKKDTGQAASRDRLIRGLFRSHNTYYPNPTIV